jgi:lysophospholipase L1-like esterase
MNGHRPILYWGRVAVIAAVASAACVLAATLLATSLRSAVTDARRSAVIAVPDVSPAATGSIPKDEAPPALAEPAVPPAPAYAPGSQLAALAPAAGGGNEPGGAEAPETSTLAVTPSSASRGRRGTTEPARGSGLTILQIGDSHTSADFLTGALRKRLQQRYGSGGPGYITAGRPHIGVRSSAVKVSASPGWTYQAIQKSENVGEFWLSGFNAVATAPGEALAFAADVPMTFDSIEIEAVRRPGGGSIDISLDGAVKSSYDLDAEKVQPVVLRLLPSGVTTDRVRQIEIKTKSQGSVSIASVAIYNRQSGVAYNSIGYPGATVDLLNKFDPALLADDLRRLNPQIVVLSFGTNEASKKNLDLVRYEQTYEKAIDRIKAVLPAAQIVLIGPPDGDERAPHCAGKSAEAVCRTNVLEAPPPPAAGAAPAKPADCDWHPLPKLEAVRDIERRIAERRGLAFWNWAAIMPRECGAHRWAQASPALMAPDHVHFTIGGYNKSAERFLDTLIPVIEKLHPKTAAAN